MQPGSAACQDPSPRPAVLLGRLNGLDLCGVWECAIVAQGAEPKPDHWQPIQVPFAVEMEASGVAQPLLPDQCLHYRRRVEVPPQWQGKRLRLCFAAVDHSCEVYVDGQLVATHTGGYLPFDVVVAASDRSHLDLYLKVTDPTDSQPIQRGKQSLKPETIWYTATSGVWGEVWMEALPEVAITDVDIRPLEDLSGFRLLVRADSNAPQPYDVKIQAPGGETISAQGISGQWLCTPVPDPALWSPNSPNLYRFTVRLGEDEACSASGLRRIELSPQPPQRRRHPRKRQILPHRHVLLNDEPVLINAPLWQGYWARTGMTPPSEAALRHDLQTLKDMGFNAVRVHIKVECPRFYELCDELGLMVVQDMVSGGRAPLGIRASGVVQALGYTLPDRSTLFRRWTGRADAANRRQFAQELAAMIRRLRRHPSVVIWVPFNEAWGQFDARKVAAAVRRLDPTRLVDAASGWFDQGGGDFRSRHRYVLRLLPPPRRDGRPFYLSEFGGLNLAVPGHTWGESQPYGYRFLPSPAALAEAITALYREQLIPLAARGLAACTYTQVSDVERENNGLMTFDREVTKIDPALIAELNTELYAAFNRAVRLRA